MKKKYFVIGLTIIVATLFITSCDSNSVLNKKLVTEISSDSLSESEILIDFLEKSGNIINQKVTPQLVSAGQVYYNLDNYHLIDLRTADKYKAGHIKGAIHVEWENLVDYMKYEITAAKYEKIVFVCNSGTKSSYVAMMFQLLGYDNAYSMKWGMSAVDPATAKIKWDKAISNQYVDQLEKKGNSKAEKGKFPIINTGKKIAYNILEKRVKELLKKHDFKLKASDWFANSGNYYTINYMPMSDYAQGHLPGAIQYSPRKSLTREKYLSTLPVKKPIAVYCYTGHHAAFVVAYLQVLGYEAYTIPYGANAFMHSKIKAISTGKAYDRNKHHQARALVVGELP